MVGKEKGQIKFKAEKCMLCFSRKVESGDTNSWAKKDTMIKMHMCKPH